MSIIYLNSNLSNHLGFISYAIMYSLGLSKNEHFLEYSI